MSGPKRIFVMLAIALTFLVPGTVAQKPPAPAPSPTPPSTPTGRPATNSPLNSDPTQQKEDLVMFLQGRVATHDGTVVPHDVLVERVCNNRVRQQVYASPHGDFSMQLGSRNNVFFDATGDPGSQEGAAGKNSLMGIPRRELTNCELRASAPGFYSSVISLMGDLNTFGGSIDVGAIVVQRATKIEGTSLSAIPYKAPKDARRAYEKGLQAVKNGKLADAHKYFETAVKIYPDFAFAWFQFGTVLQAENQKDAARNAYTQATTIDTKFVPPYLSLASIAYETENWREVLALTGHILDLDPLNHTAITSYVLDLDPVNYSAAYFYNAMANYKLNRIEDAVKSGLKAEHLDLRTHFPQVHLLLAELFARKNNYPMAITEAQIFLDLAPHAKDADRVREQIAKWEKLNGSVPASEKSDPR